MRVPARGSHVRSRGAPHAPAATPKDLDVPEELIHPDVLKDPEALAAFKASYAAAMVQDRAAFMKLDEMSAGISDGRVLRSAAAAEHQKFYVEANGGQEYTKKQLQYLMSIPKDQLVKAGLPPDFIKKLDAAKQMVEKVAKQPFDKIKAEDVQAIIEAKTSDGVNGPITRLTRDAAILLGKFENGMPTLGDGKENPSGVQNWMEKIASIKDMPPAMAEHLRENGLNKDGSINFKESRFFNMARGHVERGLKPKTPSSTTPDPGP